jgi:predicted NAD/FAD-dependent oxidoreductase
VIVATPAPVAAELARDVLAPAERDFHAGVTYEPAITLEVRLSDPVSSRPLRVRVPHSEGWPIASLALEPGRQGGRVPDGCAVARLVARSDWSRAHLDAPDDAIAKELCRPLQRLFPVTTERTRDVRVARWPLALPRFEVGRYRALARLRRVEADRAAAGRRVWFAGDHLVAPSVEGAVTSGLRAADAAISRLGL